MHETKGTAPAARSGAALAEQEPQEERPSSLLADGEATGPCPNCGAPMNAIRGSKSAICRNCGFKDSCCF